MNQQNYDYFGKFSLISCCRKKRKYDVSQTKKYCWVNVSEDFKIVMDVSVDSVCYVIFVSTLHVNRLA